MACRRDATQPDFWVITVSPLYSSSAAWGRKVVSTLIHTRKPIPKELAGFFENCLVRQLRTKQVIVRPGDAADKLYYIIEGSATISMANELGTDIILGYLNDGDFIGETGLFMQHGPRQVTVRTRTPAVVAEITYIKLMELSKGELKEQFSGILFAVGTHISKRLLQTTRKVEHLAFMDAAGRISNTLIDLCKQPDALTHPDGMQIKVSRTELGQLVGCSREMVGRVLKNMESEGLITAKGKTIVIFGAR